MKGIVHHEFVPPNTTINPDFCSYCDVETPERKCATKKTETLAQPQLAPSSQQCASPHFWKTTEFVTDNMVIIPDPPYSPDLAQSDFALFNKLKIKLKGHFETVSDIQRELQTILHSIKENDFHSAFEAWKKRWDRCIHTQGDYSEGDGSQN
jgi:hypothetical protein